jgi:hypothetical protein
MLSTNNNISLQLLFQILHHSLGNLAVESFLLQLHDEAIAKTGGRQSNRYGSLIEGYMHRSLAEQRALWVNTGPVVCI